MRTKRNEKRSLARRAAAASWMLPIGGMIAMAIARGAGEPVVERIVAAAGSLGILVGMVAGVLALCRIPRDGREGVLLPACAGLGLSAFLALSAIWGIRDARHPPQRARPEAGATIGR